MPNLKQAIDELKKKAFSKEKDPRQRCLILQDLRMMVKSEKILETKYYKSQYLRTGKPLKP